MFSILITEKGGAQQQLDFDEAEIAIGRQEDNALCLPKNNVSKHHARLLYKDDRYVIVDQQSTNGTYVNGRRITGPAVVRPGDKIYIGDFILMLGGSPGARPLPQGQNRPLLNQRPLLTNNPVASARHPSVTEASSVPEEILRQAQAQAQAQAERRRSGLHSTAMPAPHPSPAGAKDSQRPRPSPPPLPPRAPSLQPSQDAAQPSHDGHKLTAAPSQAAQPRPRRPTADPRAPTSPLTAAQPTQPAPSLTTERRGARTGNARSSSIPPLPPLGTPASAEGVDSAQAAALSGLTSPAVLAPNVRLQTALSSLMERLSPHLDIQRREESAFPSEHQRLLDELIEQLENEGALAQDIDRALLRESAINEAVGLGPLERLLTNRQVKEIVVDGPTCVHADLGGGLTRTSSFFSDDSAVLVIAARLLHRAGQKLSASQMLHEARLPGGGTVQLLLPPLSPRGPLLSVRCPTRAQHNPESYVGDGVLSTDMLARLRGAMQQRDNVLVVGAAGSGVSELLMLLSQLVPEHERIVTIEESPNASLLNPQAIPLCRRALAHAGLHELLQRAALLRTDRLVIDDLRLDEANTALLAAAGSGGVLLGMHAPDPAVALGLLAHSAELALGGNSSLATGLIGAAVQLFVHVGKDPAGAGTRRVLSILELKHNADGAPELRPLFRLEDGAFVASFPNRR